jgi:tetratricopeptide (TPR) repeat protein
VRLAPVNERFAIWRDELGSAPGSPLFRGYLQLLTNCLSRPFGNTTPPEADASVPERASAPMLRYRAGLCGRAEELTQLRAEDAEFVDVDYPLARRALDPPTPELDEALTRATAAAEAFPESLAILTLLGTVRTEREEFAEALVQYERVLERLPVHRDAMLGRTIALSRLGRYDAGLASSTRMIDLGAWYLGEAHYWRAWNEFQLQRYPGARVDADRAKTLILNASVFVLSGLMEWNERRLPTADSELVEALKMDFGRCDAARYLGRIRTQRNMRPEAIAAFTQAIQCYTLAITTRERLIADVEAGTATPGTKARVATGHRRAIADAMRDREECVTNRTALEQAGRS